MRQEQGYYIAENINDFDGYQIIYIEYWKEGVKRIHVGKYNPTGSSSFYIIFCSDDIAKHLIEGEMYHGSE